MIFSSILCSRVPVGVLWGKWEKWRETNDAGTGNRLKQVQFILGRGKPYILPTLPQTVESTELESVEVIWSLFVVISCQTRMLLSRPSGRPWMVLRK